MKIAIILMTLCIASMGLYAQQYQCLQPGTRQYFTNNSHYLRGMRIDSSTTIGSATVFYPFHTPRFTGPLGSIDSNGGSWLGKKVIQLGDGTTYFDNIWKDTVTIKTWAGLGDTWIFYNDTSATYYTATVIAQDTGSVLGLLDSLKTVRLTAMKGSSVLTANPVNGFTFTLSKNHGFVRIFDLYTFPYQVGTHSARDYFLNYAPPFGNYQFSITEYHNPAYTDIYDFSVGDAFCHIFSMDNPTQNVLQIQGYTQFNVLTKSQSPTGISYTITELRDQIAYDYNGKIISATGPGIHFRTNIPNTTLYIEDSVKMPEERGNWFSCYYDPTDTSRCTVSALYKREHFYLTLALDVPANEMETYKAGFGLVDSTNGYAWGFNGVLAQLRLRMSASLKNGVGCGIFPAALGSISPASSPVSFRFYPNPARDIVILEYQGPTTNGTHAEVTITDLSGRLVYQQKGIAKKISINTTAFSAGLYMLRTAVNGAVSNQKLTIIH